MRRIAIGVALAACSRDEPRPAPVVTLVVTPDAARPIPIDAAPLTGSLLGDDDGGLGELARHGPIGIGPDQPEYGGTGALRGSKQETSLTLGAPEVVGDLAPAVITHVVKKGVPKLRYCYEKELAIHPDLAGAVTATFFVSPRGDVASSQATGLGEDTSHCIASVIEALAFPSPKGGGGAKVTLRLRFDAR